MPNRFLIDNIYSFIIHTKLIIEGNAQNILTTQYNIKVKTLNATHGSKLKSLSIFLQYAKKIKIK